MAKYPSDQFDDIPADLNRVGAHRVPPKAGRGWITFAWAALFTGIFVAGGLFGLSYLRSGTFLGSGENTLVPEITETPTAEPVLDPSTIDPARAISITILNGTPTIGLAQTAGDALTAKGWTIGTMLAASATTETKTIAYYSDPANEDVARGLILALGVGEVRESSAYNASVTLVLGSDYTAVPAS